MAEASFAPGSGPLLSLPVSDLPEAVYDWCLSRDDGLGDPAIVTRGVVRILPQEPKALAIFRSAGAVFGKRVLLVERLTNELLMDIWRNRENAPIEDLATGLSMLVDAHAWARQNASDTRQDYPLTRFAEALETQTWKIS